MLLGLIQILGIGVVLIGILDLTDEKFKKAYNEIGIGLILIIALVLLRRYVIDF